MFAVAYIFLVSGLFVATLKYAPEPRISPNGDPFLALFMLGCYLLGGVIGFMLPETAASYIGLTWGDGPLERAAKLFGAAGGFMIAVRGTVIWGVLFILAAIGYGGLLLWGYIFQH
jgi:hypothetical protein